MSKRWDPVGSAIVGAGIGLMLVVVHEGHAIYSGDIGDVDPFTHIMAEIAVMSTFGAILFAVFVEFMNRRQR